jgi:hypothetical protein
VHASRGWAQLRCARNDTLKSNSNAPLHRHPAFSKFGKPYLHGAFTMNDITASQTEQTALDEKQAESRKNKLSWGWAIFLFGNFLVITGFVPFLLNKTVPGKELAVQVMLLSIAAPGFFIGKMKHRVWYHIALSVGLAGCCALMDLMQ